MRKQKEEAKQGLTAIVNGFKLLFKAGFETLKELYSLLMKVDKQYDDESEDNYFEAEEEFEEECEEEDAEEPEFEYSEESSVQYANLDELSDSIFEDTDDRDSADLYGDDYLLTARVNEHQPEGATGENLQETEDVLQNDVVDISELDKTAPDSPALARIKKRIKKE